MQTMQSARTGAHIDKESLLGNGSRKRSDVRWLMGAEVLHVDVAVCTPSSPHALAKDSHLHTDVASTLSADQKRREYDGALRATGLNPSVFHPVVFEVTGRPGKEVADLCEWLAQKAQLGGNRQADWLEISRKFVHKCSEVIWLHNAKILSAVVRTARDVIRR